MSSAKRTQPQSFRLAVILAVATVALLAPGVLPAAAQENFSAGKPAPQLFASDCTGGGCHKGPQGLAKGQSQSSLSGFLREHYTNSRESAAALAGYLLGARGAAPSEARAPRSQPAARSSRAAAHPEETAPATPPARPRTAEPSEPPKPAPPARAQRGRHTAATPPPPVPIPPPEPAPAAAPPPPAKPQFDIFD